MSALTGLEFINCVLDSNLDVPQDRDEQGLSTRTIPHQPALSTPYDRRVDVLTRISDENFRRPLPRPAPQVPRSLRDMESNYDARTDALTRISAENFRRPLPRPAPQVPRSRRDMESTPDGQVHMYDPPTHVYDMVCPRSEGGIEDIIISGLSSSEIYTLLNGRPPEARPESAFDLELRIKRLVKQAANRLQVAAAFTSANKIHMHREFSLPSETHH